MKHWKTGNRQTLIKSEWLLLHADEWRPVTVLFASPARQTNRIRCFLARGPKSEGAQSLGESEEISFEFASQDEVRSRIRNGDFNQALHAASYFLAIETLNAHKRA